MKQNDVYIKTIKQHLEDMDKEKIKRCFLEIANNVPEETQSIILEVVQNCAETNKGNIEVPYKPRMSEALVEEKINEILTELENIKNQEIYLEANGYEDYSSGSYWDRDWVWEYFDNMGIGTKIEKAVSFARDCVNDRRYVEALDIIDRILDLEVWVDDECDGFTVDIEELEEEKIAKIDLKQMALLALYSDYQIRDKSERAADLYTYFGYSAFKDIHVEEMRNVGREELKGENNFWEDWIALLSEKNGNLETRLLKEAVLFTKGADGLAEIARKKSTKHPSLFLDALKEYELNHDYQKMVVLGTEAVETLDKKYRIRSKIALRTSVAEYYLGREDEIKRLWFETYVSDMNEVNYLRLFINDDLVMNYGMKAKDLPRKTQKASGNYNEKSELEENILDFTTAVSLNFLAGEFEKVKAACVNPKNSLGWSGEFIGRGIKLFLLYLYNDDKLKTATKSLADQTSRAFGFKENEEFGYLESGGFTNTSRTVEIFWTAYRKWKQYFSISETEKTRYLSWLEDIIDKRTTAIVSGKFRNHYSSVALLLMALGEVKETLGYREAKKLLRENYKKRFPRHSSFNGAINEYF